MTLYFLRTGQEPFPSQHQHQTWTSDLEAYAKQFTDKRWRSLSIRFFRLIKAATQHKQARRWDVSQIEGELLRLQEACNKPKVVKSAELWAEELAARVSEGNYQWDDDSNRAMFRIPTNLSVTLEGSESRLEVAVGFRWVADGSGKHSKVTKWIRDSAPQVYRIMHQAGWNVSTNNATSGILDVSGTISVDRITQAPGKIGKTLEEAIALLAEKGYL